LKDYKQKYSLKDQDYKEVNKELVKSKKELVQAQGQLTIEKQRHASELVKLKREHEQAIEDLTQKLESQEGSTTVAEKKALKKQESLEM